MPNRRDIEIYDDLGRIWWNLLRQWFETSPTSSLKFAIVDSMFADGVKLQTEEEGREKDCQLIFLLVECSTIKLDEITIFQWYFSLVFAFHNKVIACGPDNPLKQEKSAPWCGLINTANRSGSRWRKNAYQTPFCEKLAAKWIKTVLRREVTRMWHLQSVCLSHNTSWIEISFLTKTRTACATITQQDNNYNPKQVKII